MKPLSITWIARSFADYRIAVHKEIDQLCEGHLTIITNKNLMPERIRAKEKLFLQDRLIELEGEKCLFGKKIQIETDSKPNKSMRLLYQPNLLKQILATKPDVMFADAFFQWSLAPLLLRIRYKIPYVMGYERTAHVEKNAQWYRRFPRKLALNCIDAVCVNGSLTAKHLHEDFGYPSERMFSGQMAADTDLMSRMCDSISPQERMKLKKEKKLDNYKAIYTYVGRLIPGKGLIQLLQGWDLFSKKERDAALLIVGHGYQREELENFIDRNNIPNVFFSGPIDYDEIYTYYAISDCFVIATLYDNWSLVVPEAMACGLPILCSCYNGCHPELVTSENGMVFDPLKVESTVKALEYIWQNRTLLPNMGKASRHIVSQHTPHTAAACIYNACQYAYEQNRKRN